MNPEVVNSAATLCSFIDTLVTTIASSYPLSLEEYLRALWKRGDSVRESTPSWSLFADLLKGAFATEPVPFDHQWLAYTHPPSSEVLEPYNEPVDDDYGVLKHMLLYQIADLHRMRSAGTLERSPEQRWLGARSSSEVPWYNFTPATFLNAASPLTTVEGWNAPTCHWRDLANLLLMGQSAE